MVTPDDIAVSLGRSTFSDLEMAQWVLWIDEALLLVRTHYRTRVGVFATLDPEALDYVVRRAVVSQVQKPDDATQVDVSVDDARVSRRYSSSPGRVTILDEWWDLLDPDGGVFDSAAFSIRAYGEPDPVVLPVLDWS